MTLVEPPWSQMQPALIGRSIHAGLAYEPFASRTAAQRDFRVLSWLEDTLPPEGYLVSVILMNSKWVTATEDVTRRFVRAYTKGIAITNDPFDRAYALASKCIGLSVEDLKRARPHEFEKDGQVRMEALRKTADRMKQMGLIEKLPDLDQAVWSGPK